MIGQSGRMPPSLSLSVPLKLLPGGKTLLLSLLVSVLVGKCGAGGGGGNFKSSSVSNLLLPLLSANLLPNTEARVSAKERGGAAGGEKVGALVQVWFWLLEKVHSAGNCTLEKRSHLFIQVEMFEQDLLFQTS